VYTHMGGRKQVLWESACRIKAIHTVDKERLKRSVRYSGCEFNFCRLYDKNYNCARTHTRHNTPHTHNTSHTRMRLVESTTGAVTNIISPHIHTWFSSRNVVLLTIRTYQLLNGGSARVSNIFKEFKRVICNLSITYTYNI
jgi:hypothetical protein